MFCENIKKLLNIRIISDIILIAVPFLYIFSSLSLLVNIQLSSHHLLIYWFAFFILILWLNQVKNVFLVGIWLVIFIITGWFATELSTYFIDAFWDSRTYHGPATLYLADGWNPFYNWHCCGNSTLPLLKVDERVLLESYPKAQWIITATVQATFGYLEKTHVINIWLLAAVFVSSIHFLRTTLRLNIPLILLAALTITANPVILCQVFSGYIDGTLAATLTIFLLSGITFIHSRKKIYLLYSLIYLPILINTKMTGLVYGTFFALFLLAYSWWINKTPPKNLALLGLGVWLSAVLLFGFNPYITNTIQYHNPFHIAYSFGSNTNVISDMAVPEFIAKNRFEKFLIATFSTGDKVNWKKPEWKIPFTSLEFEPSADTRFSGFGPLFSGLLVIAGLLALFLRNIHVWVIIATITISIFITDAAWWPRLSPQFWLVPILIVLFAPASCNHSKYEFRIKYLSIFLLTMLVFNSTIVAANTWSEQRQAELEYRQLYYKNLAGIVTGAARGSDTFQLYSLHRIQHMGFEGHEVADCPNDSTIKRKSRIIRGVTLCVPVKIKRLQEILDKLQTEKQIPIVLLLVTDPDAIRISTDTLAIFKQIGLDFDNQEKTSIFASNQPPKAKNIRTLSPEGNITLMYQHPVCPMQIKINSESFNKQNIYKISINGVDLFNPFDRKKLLMNLIVIYDDEIIVYLFPRPNNNDYNAVNFGLQYQIKAVCS